MFCQLAYLSPGLSGMKITEPEVPATKKLGIEYWLPKAGDEMGGDDDSLSLYGPNFTQACNLSPSLFVAETMSPIVYMSLNLDDKWAIYQNTRYHWKFRKSNQRMDDNYFGCSCFCRSWSPAYVNRILVKQSPSC